MPPSSDLPGGQKPASSFGSVDWLSQSSRTGPSLAPRGVAEVRGTLSAPARVPSGGGPPQTPDTKEMKSVAGLSQEADSTRPACTRARTAFTDEQVSTLESCFLQHRYLGPAERRRLAWKMGLSEVQVKTWFQNRRMKHRRQLQDSQLSTGFSGAAYALLAFCPLPSAWGGCLQSLHPWASLPGPSALAQSHGSFRGPCPVEQASLASMWATSGRQPLMCYLPAPGSPAYRLGPALSSGTCGVCLPESRDSF